MKRVASFVFLILLAGILPDAMGATFVVGMPVFAPKLGLYGHVKTISDLTGESAWVDFGAPVSDDVRYQAFSKADVDSGALALNVLPPLPKVHLRRLITVIEGSDAKNFEVTKSTGEPLPQTLRLTETNNVSGDVTIYFENIEDLKQLTILQPAKEEKYEDGTESSFGRIFLVHGLKDLIAPGKMTPDSVTKSLSDWIAKPTRFTWNRIHTHLTGARGLFSPGSEISDTYFVSNREQVVVDMTGKWVGDGKVFDQYKEIQLTLTYGADLQKDGSWNMAPVGTSNDQGLSSLKATWTPVTEVSSTPSLLTLAVSVSFATRDKPDP